MPKFDPRAFRGSDSFSWDHLHIAPPFDEKLKARKMRSIDAVGDSG